MSITTLIIKREFFAKVRNKSFIVMTFLSPLLFVAIAIFVGYLSAAETTVKRVAIHDETGLFVKDFLAQNAEDGAYQYLDYSQIDNQFLKDSIVNNGYEGLLIIPKTTDLEHQIEFVSNASPSVSFIENAQAVIAAKITQLNFEKAHLDTLAIRKAQANVIINIAKTSGEQGVKGLNEAKIAIGGAFGYLIMMFIIIYGNMVMRSVIEEKTNRIVEIIISSVKPFQLMIGKIIGTSLAGILQFSIWVIIGLSLLFLASAFLGVDVGASANVPSELLSQTEYAGTAQLFIKELWNLPIASILISFMVYFIGGYFLYSSFYAAIGAAVDNQTDSQQFLLPVIMPLILSVYVGFFSVVNDPDSTIAVAFSIFPLTSPIVMLMRIPFGVPWWQIAISLTLLFATFLGVVWFAAKIYRVGILMYGKKPSWKELYKWLKY
ncbi:ABC-2 type transport system permease protein [Flavobacterium flevense]|uniref:ABC transporter permease n=1 Tax=Flavobacterium flevense TaxID=983 RepID=A0A4Y4B3K2_9FLAO|nr:ABC transporter permease [Flavobacterium flevense]GEC73627.1 ABC transporter permease [Flavobacterium flevense]SHL28617.1 ABC-2 type transport system permease protein [Flavobacterium flevense]